MRHIIPISGKDSLCTAIVQMAKDPSLKYEFIFCDVRMELPETYAWLEKVEKKLGVKIVRLGRSLEDIMAEVAMLPSHHRRFCTRLGKIYSIRDYVGKERAVQYMGIRCDEQRPGAGSFGSPNMEFCYPLQEMHIDLQGVYKILEKRDLLPPDFFWQRLFDEVREQASEWSRRWIDASPPWVRSYLFSWRSRSNCYMCFYQRLYEWVGLLEHHPDLFDRAEALESLYGDPENVPSKKEQFFWREDGPMSHIRNRAESIFQKRVDKVRRAAVEMRYRSSEEGLDALGLTSCGLYCGK